MDLKVIAIQKPEEVNLILGQAHFIKAVEDKAYDTLADAAHTGALKVVLTPGP